MFVNNNVFFRALSNIVNYSKSINLVTDSSSNIVFDIKKTQVWEIFPYFNSSYGCDNSTVFWFSQQCNSCICIPSLKFADATAVRFILGCWSDSTLCQYGIHKNFSHLIKLLLSNDFIFYKFLN